MDAWWTAQQAGLIGGIGGSAIGVLGGVIGCCAGVLVPKGKGKPFVVGMMWALVGVGVIALVFGIVALILGQPYHVWYPFVLVGIISPGVGGSMIPVIKKQYAMAEQRQLEAEAIRRG